MPILNNNAAMNEMNEVMHQMNNTMSSMTTGLTDAELRASPIPITGNVNATFTSNSDDLSFILISTATTNTNVLKNSAGILTNVRLNIDVDTGLMGGTSFSYLKIYDKATTPTSSDTPKLLFKLSNGADFTLQSTRGIQFNNGISIRITRNVAFNDNNAIDANEVVGSFIFD